MTSIKRYFIIFCIFLTFFNVQILSQCVDYFDVLDRNSRRDVPCPHVTDDLYKRGDNDNDNENQTKFLITGFNCNNSTESICENVKNTLYLAGKVFEETFILNTPVLINLNFVNLCTINPSQCDIQGERIIIGGALSARDILMSDNDGISRFYPQALVKQFQYATHPEYAPFDINATFNSAIDWHFPTDTKNIQPNQIDLVYVMLHELMHGLGFVSYWQKWFNTNNPNQFLITTKPVVDIIATLNNETIFQGFKESAYDRLLIFNSNNQNLSEMTAEFNKFAEVGTIFPNVSDLVQHFLDSKQLNLAEYMDNVTTTPGTVSLSCENEIATAETSISPFQTGASVTHFQQSYINTTDFLMTTVQVRGKTLDDLMKQTGATSPIGPKLQAYMECIGLGTKNNPNPYRPQLAPQLAST